MRSSSIAFASGFGVIIVALGFYSQGSAQDAAQAKGAASAAASPLQSKNLAEVPATLSDRPDDEKAVRSVLRSLVEAYNGRKADAIAALLAENALLLDSDGSETEGRQAIADFYKTSFDAGDTDALQGTIDGVRFTGPDSVSLRGDFQLLDKSGTPTSVGRFRVASQRVGGKWLVSEIQDYAVEPVDSGSNYAQLQQLEWMVGDWVDESENIKVSTQIRWDDNHNFLIRTYEVELEGAPASSGTQIIGWDPQKQQIRSWVFDSLGSFGEGTWQSQGTRWVIKNRGVVRSGLTTSSTQVIEMVNNDAARLTSFDRSVGDDTLDDIDEVMMVRKAPPPAADAAAQEAKPAAANAGAPAAGAATPAAKP